MKDRARSRIPTQSVFYRRVLPAVVIGLALLTLVLIAVAVGVLAGWIPWT